MSDDDDSWGRYIDEDGIARLPADEFRRLVNEAERGKALDAKTNRRVMELVQKARVLDGDVDRIERGGPGRTYDPVRAHAVRMEAAGYRAEAMAIAIRAL